MYDIKGVQIVPIQFGARDEAEILQNLKVLFTTFEGTVPLDRKFGISVELLDEPIPVAEGKLLVEYIEKAAIYEPRAIIEDVTFLSNQEAGILIPKVVISIGFSESSRY